MKTILIIYAICLILSFLYLSRDKIWFRWFWYSATYRIDLWQVKKHLALLNENNRLLALVQWLDADYWQKKHWFGKKIEKYILKEVEKFK